MTYFDIHTHQYPVSPEDIAIVNHSVEEGQNTAFLRIEKERQGVVLPLRSYGIHPWYIYDVEEQMEVLRSLVSDPDVVAIGEAGLDRVAATSFTEQRRVFMEQVKLSEEVGKPIIIHCVKAWAELIACRKEACPRQTWVIHGFRGNGELATQLIRQGFYLSFGECFQPSAVCAAWPDFLFAETDDKPIDIRIIYQNLSHSLSIPETEFAAQIEKNVHIFRINP